jgi:hypothetical protein
MVVLQGHIPHIRDANENVYYPNLSKSLSCSQTFQGIQWIQDEVLIMAYKDQALFNQVSPLTAATPSPLAPSVLLFLSVQAPSLS